MTELSELNFKISGFADIEVFANDRGGITIKQAASYGEEDRFVAFPASVANQIADELRRLAKILKKEQA